MNVGQVDGDSGHLNIMQTNSDRDEVSDQLIFEFKNPETNQVFLRASAYEAENKLKRLSTLVDLHSSNGDLSESNMTSYENNSQVTICGQKSHIVKSILQKMLGV